MAAKDISVASRRTESERQPSFPLEPFVDADSVSSFLSVPRSDVPENDAGRQDSRICVQRKIAARLPLPSERGQ
jgi:hypothetical protein